MANDPTDEPTCGKGLAERSALPLRLAGLIDALAENLELHMTGLDLDDANARKERDAYARLAGQHRAIAAQLRAAGEEMASYRDLPMGQHDEAVMASPDILAAFEKFMRMEEEVGELLASWVERDRAMLSGA